MVLWECYYLFILRFNERHRQADGFTSVIYARLNTGPPVTANTLIFFLFVSLPILFFAFGRHGRRWNGCWACDWCYKERGQRLEIVFVSLDFIKRKIYRRFLSIQTRYSFELWCIVCDAKAIDICQRCAVRLTNQWSPLQSTNLITLFINYYCMLFKEKWEIFPSHSSLTVSDIAGNFTRICRINYKLRTMFDYEKNIFQTVASFGCSPFDPCVAQIMRTEWEIKGMRRPTQNSFCHVFCQSVCGVVAVRLATSSLVTFSLNKINHANRCIAVRVREPAYRNHATVAQLCSHSSKSSKIDMWNIYTDEWLCAYCRVCLMNGKANGYELWWCLLPVLCTSRTPSVAIESN